MLLGVGGEIRACVSIPRVVGGLLLRYLDIWNGLLDSHCDFG